MGNAGIILRDGQHFLLLLNASNPFFSPLLFLFLVLLSFTILSLARN
jgi:ABC-type dipeptide/oligopeptide/nickel transport system permease subunit